MNIWSCPVVAHNYEIEEEQGAVPFPVHQPRLWLAQAGRQCLLRMVMSWISRDLHRCSAPRWESGRSMPLCICSENWMQWLIEPVEEWGWLLPPLGRALYLLLAVTNRVPKQGCNSEQGSQDSAQDGTQLSLGHWHQLPGPDIHRELWGGSLWTLNSEVGRAQSCHQRGNAGWFP